MPNQLDQTSKKSTSETLEGFQSPFKRKITINSSQFESGSKARESVDSQINIDYLKQSKTIERLASTVGGEDYQKGGLNSELGKDWEITTPDVS